MESAIVISNEFNLKLLKIYRDAKKEGNIFYSSSSITIALAMLYTGAEQNTKKEMQDALNIKSDDSMTEGFHAVFKALNDLPDDVILNIVNLLAIDQNYKVLPDFSSNLKSNFNTDTKILDFSSSPGKACEELNHVIELATHQKIKDLFPDDSIKSSTRIVLANAIYFKGMWHELFDKAQTEKKPFCTNTNEEIVVDMMFRIGGYNCGRSSELKANLLEIPYRGKNMSMVIILPEEKSGLIFTESNVSLENLSSAIQNLQFVRRIHLSLPKFKMEESLPLKQCLLELGMKEAFSDRFADFSGISGNKDLFVSEALHKAFVEVNEEGTEAAAATGLVMCARSFRPPTCFTVDHPFLFLIREINTGLILFTGSVHTL